MKRNFCRIITLIIVLTIISSLFVMTANGEGESKMNRYNVVFVIDKSGSMNDTDPDGYRFESIDLFVSLLANGGNKVGSVVFSTDVTKNELVVINGKGDKKAVTDQIRSQKAEGWTNIGDALLAATEMLEANGDKTIPSIIILLTDGNTDLETDEQEKNSIASKETALEAARESNIPIYSIALNKDKSANCNEMKQIADATGGEFKEVTNANDLQSVFDLFYQMIYSTQSVKLVDEKVPASGVISRDFEVADLGVEEVNVVMFGQVESCSVKKPGGTAIPSAELNEMIYKSNTFTLVKIPSPEKGIWNLTVNAKAGSTVKIFKIYNSNMSVDATVNPTSSYGVNQAITFNAKIKENDTVVSDLARYAGYKAVLRVKKGEEEVFTQEATVVGTNGFEISFTPSEIGTYTATVSIETDALYAEAQPFTLDVGNTAPVATNPEGIKKHINRWPFLIKTDSTIDLAQTATDAEDATLTYKVKSSTWMQDDYTLEGDKLTINKFSVSKGSFTIEAYDSMGAYCTYDVKVTSTNIGLWAVILILGGGLLALIIIGIVTYRLTLIPFMGEFFLENLATNETTNTQKGRGRLKFSSIQIGPTPLSPKCYFQATGKNFVYFISPKPVCVDNSFKKTKKVKIPAGVEVKISTTDTFEDGIMVRFESMLMN